MPTSGGDEPKHAIYLISAGATQAEADRLGAQPVNLLMRDNVAGEGLSTRILRRCGASARSFLVEHKGIDIEKLLSLLTSSGAAHTQILPKRCASSISMRCVEA
jgi:hypothetical protein